MEASWIIFEEDSDLLSLVLPELGQNPGLLTADSCLEVVLCLPVTSEEKFEGYNVLFHLNNNRL